MSKPFDSRENTIAHITLVRDVLDVIIEGLQARADNHDSSKLESPEKEFYDKAVPLLQQHEFGTEAHSQALDGIREGLEHHYANNSHHPEHYSNGMKGFDLVDLVELFADWQAAGVRDGKDQEGLVASLDIMKGKYDISDTLYSILKNTIVRYSVLWTCQTCDN